MTLKIRQQLGREARESAVGQHLPPPTKDVKGTLVGPARAWKTLPQKPTTPKHPKERKEMKRKKKKKEKKGGKKRERKRRKRIPIALFLIASVILFK